MKFLFMFVLSLSLFIVSVCGSKEQVKQLELDKVVLQDQLLALESELAVLKGTIQQSNTEIMQLHRVGDEGMDNVNILQGENIRLQMIIKELEERVVLIEHLLTQFSEHFNEKDLLKETLNQEFTENNQEVDLDILQ